MSDRPPEPTRQSGAHVIITAASLVIVVAGLRAAATVIVPVMLAAFIAIIISPVFMWFVRRRVPTIISVLLTVLLLLGASAVVMTAVAPSIERFSGEVPRLTRDLAQRTRDGFEDLEAFLERLRPESDEDEDEAEGEPEPVAGPEQAPGPDLESGLDQEPAPEQDPDLDQESGPDQDPGLDQESDPDLESGALTDADIDAVAASDARSALSSPMLTPPRPVSQPSPIDDLLDPQAFMRFIASMLSSVQTTFTSALLIALIIVFILLEAASFPEKLRAVLGSDHQYERVVQIVTDIRRYMGLKTLISALTGVCATLLLTVLQVDYPVMWGMLAFFLNFIPNLGSLIAALPPVLLAVISDHMWTATWVATGYIVINISIGSLLEPRVMGQGFGLSTLVVFLSLILWGWIFGPVGMLMSVPLTMAAKIALGGADDSRWIADLLGSAIPARRDTP